MKHLYEEEFMEKLILLAKANTEDISIHGITICRVYENFIKDLFENGFTIKEIVIIFNFLFYELGIDIQLKYYHIHYCIKRNNFIASFRRNIN